MQSSRMAAAMVLAFLLAGEAVAKDAIAVGDYCSRDDLKTPDGTALGEFRADAEVRRAGPNLTIAFSNSMPDSGQIIEIEPATLRMKPNGAFAFRFVDNWDAKGVGTVRSIPKGIVADIERTGPASDSWGENAGRGYGKFDLKPAPC